MTEPSLPKEVSSRKFREDFKQFIKNSATFDAIAQKVAQEEGVGELSKDELEWVRYNVLKSLKELGK